MAKTLKAEKGSNAAKKADYEGTSIVDGESSSDPAKLGYSVFAYPDAGPARSNSDIKNTGGTWPIQREQDGTGIDAYKKQDQTIDAKTGK